jgi:hypothetical protein
MVMRSISRVGGFAVAAAINSLLFIAHPALAGTVNVTVDATAGPWVQSLNPSFNYGIGDNTAPTIVSGLTNGESVTVAYVSGLWSMFGGVPPTVDANGYVGSIFGSGPGIPPGPALTGIGSSGQPFPSYFIDPTNVGPNNIWLGELIGVFTDSTGVIVGTPFAIGNGPLTLTDPLGATQIELGANDDIYGLVNGVPDNTGALVVSVSADSIPSTTPLPATLPLFASGLGALGLLGLRRKRKAAALAA